MNLSESNFSVDLQFAKNAFEVSIGQHWLGKRSFLEVMILYKY